MNKLQQNIAALLAQDGISENELAQRSGMNQTTLNRIIRGEILDPRDGTVAPLAAYAQITVDVLKRGDVKHPYAASMPSGSLEQESELRSLRARVDSLTIALGALFSVTAQHRPIEADKLADAITGNELLDLSQHPEVRVWLAALNKGKAQAARPSARVRARSS